MPKSLANARRKVALLTTIADIDLAEVTVAELTAGKDVSCSITSDGYSITVDNSETVAEGSLCDEVIPEVFTNAKASGSLVGFRYFDEDGQPDTDDVLHTALKERGTEVYVVTRNTSKKSTEAWAVGDPIQVYKVLTDNWKEGDAAGYIKAEYPLSVLSFETNATVVAA